MDETWTLAQQSVIGSCLIDSKAIGSVAFALSDEDFEGANRTIFRAIRDLYSSGKAIDIVAVLSALGGTKDYRDYMVQLMEITPTAANVKTYVDICRERSKVNRFREVGRQLISVNSAQDAADLIRGSNKISVGRGLQSWSLAEALHNFMGRYNRKAEYIPWFLQQLNSQLDMEFGDFCLLGGRPSSGKSAFALEAAIYWAAVCGYRVGFYSLETSREKLTNRLIAACAKVPLGDIKHSRLDDKQMETVCKISARIADAPIDLITAAGKTAAEIQANAIEKRHQVVIVDYLQIVNDPGKDEYSQVSHISKSLHTMCQEMGIFCLALCQLNRTKGARPALEDLRSSGQLEQDADSVLFLHRQDGKEYEREFIIAKNKEGECRSTLLHFDGRIQHFAYMGKGNAPLKGVDYKAITARAPGEEPEQLPMETAVPFDDAKNV